MGTFALLDIFLGLTFVYLLLALVCTTLMEWVAQIGNLRGKMLEAGTRTLLGEDRATNGAVTTAFFDHALVRTMSDGKRRPSYLPSTIFASALRDVVKRRRGTAEATELPRLLKESFAALTGDRPGPEGTDGLPTEAQLAEWFDHGMERVSGSYKRKTRTIVLMLAVAVTILMNADTVSLTTQLWQNPTLRAYLVERAKVRLDQGPPLETVEYTDPTSPRVTPPVDSGTARSPDRLLAEEQDLLGRLFGWGGEQASIDAHRRDWGPTAGPIVWFLRHLIGWALTALAVSLGAPFWFDLLNRFMNIRSAGGVPAKFGHQTARGDPK